MSATLSASALSAMFPAKTVLPVLTLSDPAAAIQLATALVAGGISSVEVTLRTAKALDCIRAIAETVPDITVGVGTVLAPQQFRQAQSAGARFFVSPGFTMALADAAEAEGYSWLPGVSTVSEAMTLAERGFRYMKFFPAEPSGGVAFLQALAPVLPSLHFCPTGGIRADQIRSYLALPNVFAVGGSWIKSDVTAGGLSQMIAELRQAAAN